MNSVDALVIEAPHELVTWMGRGTLSAVWTVRCEIGPDWLGGGRDVSFELDGRPLADTELHRKLIGALIEALEIPETCSDAVISGEAEILLHDGVLSADYEWSCAVPFMNPHQSADGHRPFLALASL